MWKLVESKCPLCQKPKMCDLRRINDRCNSCSKKGRTLSPKTRAKMSASKKGLIPTTDNHKKHSVKHCNAVECFFRDPRNVIHYCKNITSFVYKNPTLFNREDVLVHRKHRYSRASSGLSQIHSGNVGSWKGWTLVGEREGRERFDLIARNHCEPPSE